MKQHSYLFFLLFAFILLQYGCKKNDAGPNVSDEEYKTIKEYVYFNPGSYWIYQDSHGNIDSMFTYESGEGLDTASGYRYFTSRMHSSYDNYDYRIFYNSGWTTFHPTRHKVFMNKSGPGDYVGEIILLKYPFVQGNILYWYNENDITSEEYYPTYMINGSNFNSVIKMHETRDVTNDYFQSTNYYIAKNVGIIQEELIDSSNVWKLIRYNIVQ